MMGPRKRLFLVKLQEVFVSVSNTIRQKLLLVPIASSAVGFFEAIVTGSDVLRLAFVIHTAK